MPVIMDTPYETVVYHLSNMPLLASVLYLAGVWAVHSTMAKRAPMAIPKPLMIFYNFAQVLINGYVAYAIAAPLGGRVWGIGLPTQRVYDMVSSCTICASTSTSPTR